MQINQRLTNAVRAWLASPAITSWSDRPNTMMLATWQGEEIAWPALDGECFDIIRVSDSSVMDDSVMPGPVALGIEWQTFNIQYPLA